MTKIVFDVCVSALAIVLLSPVYGAIAIAVKLDSPGPILYRQERIGRRGRPFKVLKFRTMVVGADKLAPNVTPEGDARITRVGRSLRHWYLDELPQLVNVILGQMSLVGPRPETAEYVAHYSLVERRVLQVRPGLIGPSTLAFMNEPELLASAPDPESYYVRSLLHRRVELDLGYVHSRSLGGDIMLLIRQLGVILKQHPLA